jgi:hypothetical protein
VCEIFRIPHCLDKRLTDGGEVFSLTHGTSFTEQKEAKEPPALSVAGRIR